MAPQNADKRCFRGQQNGHCIQQVTGLPGDFPHVFTDKVPALLARKSKVPRIAQLELKDERQLVKEGYKLLDERRIRLAAEIRAQLAQLRHWQEMLRPAQEVARSALLAAVDRHGLEELSVYPALASDEDELEMARNRLFGIELLKAQWRAGAANPMQPPVIPSPEARTTARVYHALLEPVLTMAVCGVNLRRLLREYTRTERRARAIENVLLPEIESNLKFIEEQLEILDQEETARVRQRPAG